jgi:hypothetical protein
VKVPLWKRGIQGDLRTSKEKEFIANAISLEFFSSPAGAQCAPYIAATQSFAATLRSQAGAGDERKVRNHNNYL